MQRCSPPSATTSSCVDPNSVHQCHLEDAFVSFPDDWNELRQRGLAYFRYNAVDPSEGGILSRYDSDLERAILDGRVKFEPILYEDFLPSSAAGIFYSNLQFHSRAVLDSSFTGRKEFENSLNMPLEDPFQIYEAAQRLSIEETKRQLVREFLPAAGVPPR